MKWATTCLPLPEAGGGVEGGGVGAGVVGVVPPPTFSTDICFVK